MKKIAFIFFIVLISGVIFYTHTSAQSCPLTKQQSYKSPNSPSVYYITENCTKRAFKRADVFFTYFDSWKNVKITSQAILNSIPNDSLGFMPWGPKYDPKYGALVKTVNNPKVYLLLGNEKYWITSESVFNSLNYSWNWIEDIDQRLLDKYQTASEINYTDHHPNYTLIKYANDAKIYRLEPDPADSSKQVKKHIQNEAEFNALGFRWNRIVTIKNNESYLNSSDTSESTNLPTLTNYQKTNWNSTGETQNFTLNLGEIKELSSSLSIRVESIDQSGVTLSSWAKDPKGCRIIDDNIYLKNIDSRERYSPVTNYFLRLDTLNKNSVTLSVYTGNKAYQLCNEKFEPKNQCLIFPHDNYYTINSGNISRMFPNKSQYEYNNLMLNYQIKTKEKLNEIYPATKDLYPIENTWNFITYTSNDYSPDIANANYAIFKLYNDSEQYKLINDKNYLKIYTDRLLKNDFNFEFSTDVHEFIHILFYSTELTSFCKYQKSCYLTEGIAEYLQSKIKYSPEDEDKHYSQCQKNGFKSPGSVIDNLSYKDAFEKGYTYDAGKCFFHRYENECGANALNQSLAKLLQHQDEPTIIYKSIFGILNDNCENKINYQTILNDFGFSYSVTGEKYSLSENLIYKENGCIY